MLVLVIGIAIVVATVIIVRHRIRHSPRGLRLFGALTAVAAVVVGGIMVVSGASSLGAASPPAHHHTSTTTTTAPKPAPLPKRTDCLDGDYVTVLPHAGNKASSVPTTGPQSGYWLQALAVAKHDYANLVLYWNKSPEGKLNPITTPAQMAALVGAKGTPDYGCYTIAGVDLWNKLQGEWAAAQSTAAQAPGYGVNTGVQASSDTAFQEPAGPITGDLTADKLTFPNGDVIYILKRCKNVVTTSSSTNLPTLVPSAPGTPTPGLSCASLSVGKDLIVGTWPNCTKVCVNATDCGPNGVNAPKVSANDPAQVAPTPYYGGRGTAEKVTAAQAPPANAYQPNPNYGSNPQAGQASPPGADNGNGTGGGSAGVSNPTGTPNPGGGTAQPTQTTTVTTPTGTTTVTIPGTGNPCDDPNSPACTAGQ
jgi:hypothetical protein